MTDNDRAPHPATESGRYGYESPTPEAAADSAAPPEAPTGDPSGESAAERDDVGDPGQESGDDTLTRLTAERDRYLDLLQRAQAEFENYRKRARRERADDAARAGGEVVTRLLPVLDAFDAAAGHHRDVVGPLRHLLDTAVGQVGLERLDPQGDRFDPTLHEAVEREPDEELAEPVVVEVLRPGYRLGDRLLRPAAVRVKG